MEPHRTIRPLLRGLLLLAGLLLLIALLLAMAAVLRLPAERGAALSAAGLSPGLRFAESFTRRKSSALEGLVAIPKIYRIPENALSGPAPNPDAFLQTQDMAQVEAVIRDAEELLAGRELFFSAAVPYYEPDGLRCYRDESIFAVSWIELKKDSFVTYAEVVVADASQLRRKLASDAYGEGIMLYPTEMARNCNAVVAMNGDFYRFRQMGVNVYQRQVYRWDGEKVDTCFFDTAGNMNFVYAGVMTEKEAVEDYVAENDILYSVSFGPVLIDRGVNVAPERYYLGEVYETYPRAAIGQLGERHYLLTVVSRGALIGDVAALMEKAGCTMAYALDGGQSGTIVFNGQQANTHTIYRSQRSQSDILYFASALPEGEGG